MKKSKLSLVAGLSFALLSSCGVPPGELESELSSDEIGTSEAALVTGGSVVSQLSPFSSQNKSISVACPANKVVVGGSARINGAPSGVVMTALVPTANTYTAFAAEDEIGTSANWSVQVFAICADPPAGYEIRSNTSPVNSGPFTGVQSSCSPGKTALGSGGRINGGNGQVALSTLFEGGVLSSARSTAAGFEDPNGFAGNYSVTAFTVCAQLAFGDIQVVDVTANQQTGNRIFANVRCPSGFRVTGATAFSSSGVPVEVISPDAFRLSVTVGARNDGVSGTPSLRTKVICAR